MTGHAEQTSAPDGLLYQADFLSESDEKVLLDVFAGLEFEEIRMKGVVARRTARRYGMGYDYNRRLALPGAEPFPSWLLPIRDRCAAFAGVPSGDFVQALIQRYPAGAPIGWHRDSPSYELVVGVSLLSAARLRLRRGPPGDHELYETVLEARSAYLLSGDARWSWEHHIPASRSLRYSITLRSLRG